jgi:hypothetical protein
VGGQTDGEDWLSDDPLEVIRSGSDNTHNLLNGFKTYISYCQCCSMQSLLSSATTSSLFLHKYCPPRNTTGIS